MSTTINGLLTQKPTSPVPHVGDKKRYSVTERISKAGKPWNKIKAEGEGYGKEYEVVSVEKTDFVDAHGNFSFNIDLIDLSGSGEDADAKAASPPSSNPASSAAQPTVRSTSSNGAVRTLDTVATSFYAALGKADELVTQFFSDAQRESWSAYEAADLVLRVAAGLNIESNRR